MCTNSRSARRAAIVKVAAHIAEEASKAFDIAESVAKGAALNPAGALSAATH